MGARVSPNPFIGPFSFDTPFTGGVRGGSQRRLSGEKDKPIAHAVGIRVVINCVDALFEEEDVSHKSHFKHEPVPDPMVICSLQGRLAVEGVPRANAGTDVIRFGAGHEFTLRHDGKSRDLKIAIVDHNRFGSNKLLGYTFLDLKRCRFKCEPFLLPCMNNIGEFRGTVHGSVELITDMTGRSAFRDRNEIKKKVKNIKEAVQEKTKRSSH